MISALSSAATMVQPYLLESMKPRFYRFLCMFQKGPLIHVINPSASETVDVKISLIYSEREGNI